MRPRRVSLWLLQAAILMAGSGAVSAASPSACPVSWMEGGWGVSTHYFPLSKDYVARVADNIDASAVAHQAAQAGARWFLFTLHHQNWLLMAPNRTFARIVGSDSFASRRDVPRDLIKELGKVGIRPMLYVNLRLDADSGADPVVRAAMGGWPPNDRLVANIAAVYREFSLRYGTGIAGWWVDSAGMPGYVDAPSREKWYSTIAAALRAGNPKALVAFSPGLEVSRYSGENDFTAGESNDLSSVPQEGRCVEGVQWHSWTYLGGWWGADGTRFSDAQLCRYMANAIKPGGAVTFEIGTWGVTRQGLAGANAPARVGGKADAAQVSQLERLGRKLRSNSYDAAACES